MKFIRDQIDSTFSRVSVSLLPHPGKNLVYSDQLEDLEKDFLEHVKLFVETVFLPENLTPKVISGEVMTGNSMKPNILKLKHLAEPDSLSLYHLGQTSAEIQHNIGLANSVMHFGNEMAEVFDKIPFGVNELILNEKSHALKCEALTIYIQTKEILKTQAKKNIPLSYDFDTCIENQIRKFTTLNQKRLTDSEFISKQKAKKRKLDKNFHGTVKMFKNHEEQTEADLQKAVADLNSTIEQLQKEQSKADYDRLISKKSQLKLKIQEINTTALSNRLQIEESMRLLDEELREEAADYDNHVRGILNRGRISRLSIFRRVVGAVRASSKCVIL